MTFARHCRQHISLESAVSLMCYDTLRTMTQRRFHDTRAATTTPEQRSYPIPSQDSKEQITTIRMKKGGLFCSLLVAVAVAHSSCQTASAWTLPRGVEHHSLSSPSDISRGRFLRNAFWAAAASLIVPLPAYSVEPVLLPSTGEIESAIPSDWNEVEDPFRQGSKSQFDRLDSSPDSSFYSEPRFVEHVDDNAARIMTTYIGNVVGTEDTVLDLCSSWTSHLNVNPKVVVGLGMNEKELLANPSLTSWNVQDLNENPLLPYKDNAFSVVLCQLSIDYLTRPLEVLNEVGRVLQPGGTVHILFSNRIFLSKVSPRIYIFSDSGCCISFQISHNFVLIHSHITLSFYNYAKIYQ